MLSSTVFCLPVIWYAIIHNWVMWANSFSDLSYYMSDYDVNWHFRIWSSEYSMRLCVWRNEKIRRKCFPRFAWLALATGAGEIPFLPAFILSPAFNQSHPHALGSKWGSTRGNDCPWTPSLSYFGCSNILRRSQNWQLYDHCFTRAQWTGSCVLHLRVCSFCLKFNVLVLPGQFIVVLGVTWAK